ncbi:MAG: SDR family NAD(P)-dependent oxidoreductase [Bacteroidales bacterium]|nr:SDR family NAD(P)-dependent oxidoreductase [Bacteroidales bacterium]
MSKTILITGATSGIGKATAELLAEKKYRLILTGRREERLIELRNKLSQVTEIMVLRLDIRKKNEVTTALENLPGAWKDIDVLINNAGLARGYDLFHEGIIEDWEEMIDTNLKGVLYVSRWLIPSMIERKKGHIINVGSIAGREPYPRGSVYCATKSALATLTKALRMELLGYGIKVSLVAPAATETEFSLVRFKNDSERAKKVYEGYQPLRPEDVAEVISFIIERPPHVNIDDILIMPTAQASSMMFHRY